MRSEKALRRVGQSHLCFCWECSPWSDLSLSLQWGTPNSCSSPCSEGSWPWPWVAGLVCTVKVDKAIAALVRKILLQQEPRVAVMSPPSPTEKQLLLSHGKWGCWGGQQHPRCGFCLANLLLQALYLHIFQARLCPAGMCIWKTFP